MSRSFSFSTSSNKPSVSRHSSNSSKPVTQTPRVSLRNKYSSSSSFKQKNPVRSEKTYSYSHSRPVAEPPTYIYNTAPSFGMWDTLFLYTLLSSNNSNDHGWMYHHQNDEILLKTNVNI